jgi:hypothetical protein
MLSPSIFVPTDVILSSNSLHSFDTRILLDEKKNSSSQSVHTLKMCSPWNLAVGNCSPKLNRIDWKHINMMSLGWDVVAAIQRDYESNWFVCLEPCLFLSVHPTQPNPTHPCPRPLTISFIPQSSIVLSVSHIHFFWSLMHSNIPATLYQHTLQTSRITWQTYGPKPFRPSRAASRWRTKSRTGIFQLFPFFLFACFAMEGNRKHQQKDKSQSKTKSEPNEPWLSYKILLEVTKDRVQRFGARGPRKMFQTMRRTILSKLLSFISSIVKLQQKLFFKECILMPRIHWHSQISHSCQYS